MGAAQESGTEVGWGGPGPGSCNTWWAGDLWSGLPVAGTRSVSTWPSMHHLQLGLCLALHCSVSPPLVPGANPRPPQLGLWAALLRCLAHSLLQTPVLIWVFPLTSLASSFSGSLSFFPGLAGPDSWLWSHVTWAQVPALCSVPSDLTGHRTRSYRRSLPVEWGSLAPPSFGIRLNKTTLGSALCSLLQSELFLNAS